jgi:hypothetical protein
MCSSGLTTRNEPRQVCDVNRERGTAAQNEREAEDEFGFHGLADY